MKLKLKESISIEDPYKDYITQHVANVKKGFNWICENLPELMDEDLKNRVEVYVSNHDSSKYSEEEFMPYAEYFYGDKNEEVEKQFNYAWLHHIHENGHHWQHWILVHDDEPTELLEMPKEYAIEMICDWWAFSWKSGKLDEIFSWYEKHKDMQLNDSTRTLVEDILNKIKNKLNELKGN